MTNSKSAVYSILLLGTLILSGCLRPKRAADPMRSYVLSPSPAGESGTVHAGRDVGVGIGPVEIPTYLFDGRIVFRKGDSEVQYLNNHRWAERLDKGIQRVLGDNLATLLDSNRVVLSAWQRQTIKAEVYVSVQRFECDEQGHANLEARWRIATPGGDTTLVSQRSRISRPTQAGFADASAAVAELSKALADLSREIAAAFPKALAQGNLDRPEVQP